MIFEYTNYRSFLKALLAERIRKNPAYSLRAMAQQLGMVSSQLSETIRGKGGISLSSTLKIAQKIGLTQDETEYLCWLVQVDGESEPVGRETMLKKINQLRRAHAAHPAYDLSVDQFMQISEWHHSAILELADLPDFEFSPSNIAAWLDISKLDAEVAIERLERLELLVRDSAGRWKRVHDAIRVQSPTQSAAFRNFYRQMMQKASAALDSQTPDERVSGYETMTISPEALPEVREATEKYFEEIIRLSRKYPRKTEVYHLLIHFFNLREKSERK